MKGNKGAASVLTIVVLLSLLFLGGHAAAAPGEHLNWGSEVNPGQCDASAGKLVINVTHQVTNDGDSGLGGYWAYDDYNRHIQVWQVDTDTFCAVVRYQGSFETVAGSSPGNTDSIAAGIEGTFEGGYRATIEGVLDATPAYRTRGNIGSFDYGWDGHSGHGAHTPFSWPGAYFSSLTSFTYEWWGWVYHGGDNGTWVNACTGPDPGCPGNSGDITD